MSNKQALRDFQARLAQRLQAVREQTQIASWLAVDCAGLGLLLPLSQAAEIFSPTAMTLVPYSKPWMLGVANLRGGLHTVVDMAQFLGLRTTRPEATGGRLVALSPELNTNCALWVDRLLGLRSDDQLTRVAPSENRPHFASEQRQDDKGRLWQVVDLDALVRFQPFLDIVN
ncbi:chemotaxis protein CheW [Inhella gelatinilytica]|uniref:Chemotaxis protein CheW n=1 Tax=Inhella gelatinilytica TaxID=2795030 RepID=A0A931IUV5_9BURK|nr:chemotaxis protein CheW [Inhella gelatinilytica]MBH9553207.1 chemotaxis protein CheW [Inhella gelatinilytica]